MKVHKEGHAILIGLFIALVVVNLLQSYLLKGFGLFGWITLSASIIIFLLILQFFRHPSRNIAANENTILAPADGKIVVIEETMEDEFLHEKRIQISIFMSPLNVHVNRSPVAGVFEFIKYHAGKYLVAWHPKSSTENERTTLVIKTRGGDKILFRQIAGAVARRIKWYVKEGDQIGQGEEFGFIRFGSRVDVFIPLDATIDVKINQKSVGGKTVLARLNS
jgi:phosphatidylserine decarboxylase